MPLSVYNSMSREKEIFESLIPGKVGMYVCGPTVYDACHIGHARSAVVFDVVFRYLEHKGYEVTYVRNFTDVDDKIIKRAGETGTPCEEIAERYIAEFYADMDALNVRRATIEPKATAHIAQIVEVIDRLIQKGYAYHAGGDIFFSVEKFSAYGKLSGRRLEDMEAGARIDIDKKKKNPFDFVLWKAAKPGEPFWNSPWGKGRPGWHIECTAMSGAYLGDSFDIHGGGMDLTFPHHENEIAQSEGMSGKRFVKYWMHNGFVKIDQEKMSKSLGNFLTIRELLKNRHPEAIRMFLLSKHYRSPIDFTHHAMEEAARSLDRIYALLQRAGKAGLGSSFDDRKTSENLHRFYQAMDDDFNTAGAIGVMFETVHDINRTLDRCETDPKAPEGHELPYQIGALLKMGEILGIASLKPEDYFARITDMRLEKTDIDTAEIEKMVQLRTQARKSKDWGTADRLRKQLEEMNVLLEDRPEGTVWKLK